MHKEFNFAVFYDFYLLNPDSEDPIHYKNPTNGKFDGCKKRFTQICKLNIFSESEEEC